MKRKKGTKIFIRMLACMMIVVMTLSSIPLDGFTNLDLGFSASAEEEFTEGYYRYTINDDGTAMIIWSSTSISGDIKIPSTLGGHTVTIIGDGAFGNCDNLTSVTIPNSVTSIGRDAFVGCKSMISITIPNSVTSIGYQAFWQCESLTSVTIPNSVTSIGSEVFMGCRGLTSVTLSNSLSSISGSAFYNCISLTNVTIPSSVTSIDADAFENCISLTNITIPSSVTSIGNYAFYNCSSLTNITIPNGVTSIGVYAFNNTALYNNADNWENNELYFGKYLIGVKNSIAGNYSIKSGTKLIAGGAFGFCDSLTSVTIPNSVTSIGPSAFAYCSSLTNVTIPNSVTSIDEFVFYDCSSLTSITIPDSVTSIGRGAFYSCPNLKDVYYAGSKEQWNNISIDSFNEDLLNSTIHYNNSIGKIYPNGYNFYEDSYNFVNWGSSISEKYFTTIYEKSAGEQLYKKYGAGGGFCFGMAYTTAAIYNGYPSASEIYYGAVAKEYCSTLRQANKIYSNMSIGGNAISVRDYIKYAHVYQYSSDFHSIINSNENKIGALYDAVKDCVENDRIGVGIAIAHRVQNAKGEWEEDSGHEVLAVGIDGNDILIDDPNNTESLERLTVNKESGIWTYSRPWNGAALGVNSYTSIISYSTDVQSPYRILSTGKKVTPSEDVLADWGNIEAHGIKKISADDVLDNKVCVETYIEGMERLDADKVLLAVSSENYEISSEDIMQISNIPFAANESEVSENSSDMFWISNDKTVTVSNLSGENNIVELAGDDTILGADVTEETVVTMTIDDSNISTVLDTENGAECTLSLETINENYEDVLLTVTGTADGTDVSVKQTESGVIVTGISDGTVTLTKDEEVISSQEIENAVSDIEITYDKDGNTDNMEVEYKTNTEDTADSVCNYCGKTHGSSFWDRLVAFFHKIFYFFKNLFK